MLNMDFSKRIVIDTAQQEWIASPSKGVWRKPLEREAKESGHTTSVVKYEPNSHFSTHPHPHGEEILVLEGVFSDEHGDYPAGTYLRNPPGSQHAPYSKEGCV
ncbi:cupin domain-containing protein, partial [Vibrio parahaemolyticus]|uniref:cupin domain-containing protein n=1 Tax=Vibrio parahaemolyticus TaxID=670 RepID=UPI00146D4E2B